MRAFKNTSLVVGLATMPVGIASAIDSKNGNSVAGLKRAIEAEDGSLCDVEERLVNAVTGERVEDLDLVMALDLGDSMVKIDPGDLEQAKSETTLKTIEVEEFIPASRLDALVHKKSYYLQPQSKFPGVAKAMKLLWDGMRAEKKIATAKVCLRNRQARAVIAPHENGALVLHTVEWASALREPDADVLALQGEKVKPAEKKQMRDLIKAMSGEGKAFDSMEDDLAERVEALVAGGSKVEPPVAPGQVEAAGDVMDKIAESLAEIEKEKVKA